MYLDTDSIVKVSIQDTFQIL